MIRQRLVVMAVEDDRVWVDPERPMSCCSCFSKSRCFVSLQERLARTRVVIGKCDPVFEPGGLLLLELEESTLLWCSILGYLLPVVALCFGAIMGDSIDSGLNFENSELFSIILGLFGFTLSFQIKHWITARYPHRYRIRLVLSSTL